MSDSLYFKISNWWPWRTGRSPRSAYDRRLDMGRRGEMVAEKFLYKKGHRILHRNLRNPAGEIDLVTEDHGTIVFVEVKTRAEGSVHDGLEAVDATKRMQISRTAVYYLSEFREKVLTRFDVVVIEDLVDSAPVVTHYLDAFKMDGAREDATLSE